jgi:hypothetical protein
MPNGHNIAIADNGSVMVYSARRGTTWQLHARRMDRFDSDARPVAGTDGAVYPFVNPDGTEVGFVVDSQIKKVSLAGGQVAVVCALTNEIGRADPHWGSDGHIYFSTSGPEGGSLFRVPAGGGTPQLVLERNVKDNQSFFAPQLLPDGDTLLFHARTIGLAPDQIDQARIVVRSLANGTEKDVVKGGIRGRYLSERSPRVGDVERPDGRAIRSRSARAHRYAASRARRQGVERRRITPLRRFRERLAGVPVSARCRHRNRPLHLGEP